MKVVFSLIVCFAALLACQVDYATTKKIKQLNIASDILTKEDELLFKDFEKKHHLKIQIINLSIEEIIKQFKQKKYNTNIDLIITQSINGIEQIDNANMLHTIKDEILWEENKYNSSRKSWMAIGFNPYIISGKNIKSSMQYNVFAYGPRWVEKLNQNELQIFKASIYSQFRKKYKSKYIKWISMFEEKSITLQNKDDSLSYQRLISDSTQIATYYLNLLSHAIQQNENYAYPSQSIDLGCFYDAFCVGIIKHDSKYLTSLKFIQFYKNIYNNQKLCNALHILPIENPKKLSSFDYQNNYPILHHSNPQKSAENLKNI